MAISAQSLLATLDELLPGQVRLATEDDRIAGVLPQVVVEPENEDCVATVLARATEDRLAVLTRGGGTHQLTGAPPVHGDVLLSTGKLTKVLEHAPHDQTVTVEAGVTLAALQQHLGRTQQWLALDPVCDAGATIGGLIATNASGARRMRYGGVRDQLIGVRVALADGTVVKGGGKVVKNVAGYDVPKLFTGSLGTLGVIVSATFRLYPVTTEAGTVVVYASTLAALGDLATEIRQSTLVPTSMDLLPPTPEFQMGVRFESGVVAAITEQCETVTRLASSRGLRSRVLPPELATAFWSAVHDINLHDHTRPTVLLKVSLLPTEIAGWLDGLARATGPDVLTRWRAHMGHGQIFVRLIGEETTLAAAVTRLRVDATARRGSLVVVEAEPALALQVDVWGPVAGLDVMRRLKERFDPQGILNPGRFVGGI